MQVFGYPETPADRAWDFGIDFEYVGWTRTYLKPALRRSLRASGQPAYVTFWYRQSPRYLEPFHASGTVRRVDPAPTLSGMADLLIDPQGRLLEFNAVPPQVEEPKNGQSVAPDWKLLFAAAGLEPASFQPTEPKWMPVGGFDARAAWTGAYPHAPDIPLRIEAASWRGKPVFFRLIAPWTRPERVLPFQATSGQNASTWIFFGGFTVICGTAAFLAMRNGRMGRSDNRGAARLAVFVSVVSILIWVCAAHHVPTFGEWVGSTWALSSALWYAAVFWALYMALEPYVRRRWPQSLIGWTRLLGGGFHDPMVGEHILASVALGLGMQVNSYARDLAMWAYGEPPGWDWGSIIDLRHDASVFLDSLRVDVGFSLGILFLLFLFRALLRREWLAVSAILVLVPTAMSLSSTHPLADAPFFLVFMGLTLFVLIRYGLLVSAVAMIVSELVIAGMPSLDFSAWYSGRMIFAGALILGIAVYGFRTAMAGRPLWKGELLEN